jgi:hypothetical protein
VSGKVSPLSGGNFRATGLFLPPGAGETAGEQVRNSWMFGEVVSPAAGNPSVRAAGAWNKTTKAKRKASGSMANVDISTKFAGSWIGV